MFRFETLNKDNEKEALKLSVCESQKEYIETFFEALNQKLTNAYQMAWEIKLIYKNQTLIGYVMFALNPTNDLWIDHYMIDCKYQGQGYGYHAFEALLQFLKNEFPTIKQCYLSIKPNNLKAIRLYEKLGFSNTHLYDKDEVVYIIKL